MFNSFVRAVSGLNLFWKAAEAINDAVIVPVGGIDEAALNNDDKPQRALLKGKGDKLGKWDLTRETWMLGKFIMRQ